MDYIKEALEIVKAQASVRNMTAEEMLSMADYLAQGFQALEGPAAGEEEVTIGPKDAAKTIKEASIMCIVCGKPFKVITKKHLATHGMTPEQYRETFGLKKGQPLVCKSLQRERSKKMKDMKLWERRKGAAVVVAE